MPPRAPGYQLPKVKDLAQLTDETAGKALAVIDKAGGRRYTYAMCGMICGTLGLVVCTIVFAYLVRGGHAHEAYIVLGANVIGLLVQMIRARLDR